MKGHSARIKTLSGLAVLVVVLLVCTAGVAGAATTASTGGSHPSAQHSAQQDQYNTKPVVPPAPKNAVATGSAAPKQSGGTLPFTGLSLVGVVLAGVGLILLGVALRWRRSPHPKDPA
jgi:hypothetical protein